MQDLKPTSFGKTLVLMKSHPLPGQVNFLLHSNRLALNHLGHGSSSSSDLKGGVLRSIRLERGIDPALLATEACISLAQLYAIESGEEGPFYSPLLREQTARRVAQLLQVDWNNLSEQHRPITTFSNVFHLPRATTSDLTGLPVNTAAMFQKPDHVDETMTALVLTTPSLQDAIFENDSDQNRSSDSPAFAPRRTGSLKWIVLILVVYAIAVLLTLGFDSSSISQDAFDAVISKWSEWVVF